MHLPAARVPTARKLAVPRHRNRREEPLFRAEEHLRQRAPITHQTHRHRPNRETTHPVRRTLTVRKD